MEDGLLIVNMKQGILCIAGTAFFVTKHLLTFALVIVTLSPECLRLREFGNFVRQTVKTNHQLGVSLY